MKGFLTFIFYGVLIYCAVMFIIPFLSFFAVMLGLAILVGIISAILS